MARTAAQQGAWPQEERKRPDVAAIAEAVAMLLDAASALEGEDIAQLVDQALYLHHGGQDLPASLAGLSLQDIQAFDVMLADVCDGRAIAQGREHQPI